MEVPQFAHWESHYSKRSRFSCSEVRSNGFCFALSCDLPTVVDAMLETCVFLSKSARNFKEFAEERGFEYRKYAIYSLEIKVAMLKVEYILYINVLNMWDHRIRLLDFHSIGSFEPTNHCPLSPSSVARLRLRFEHFAHRRQGNAGQYPVCPFY